MTLFAEWLTTEINKRGWTEAEFARQGKITPQAVNQATNRRTRPGFRMCEATARAFGMPLEEVLRLAGILPAPPAPRVRARRIVYEAATGDRILALWRGLNPDDQALVLALLERLAAVEPRIIGDDS